MLLPTYYMRSKAQVRQLAESGVCEIEALDHTGNPIIEDKVARDLFLHYVARKQE